MDSKELGIRGEEAACAFLARRGHTIVERNWKHKRGEVDIISLDGEQVVLTEVKTRTGEGFGAPEEAVDPRKQGRLRKLGEAYLAHAGLTDVTMRFDVIAIWWTSEGVAPDRIEHYESAFEAAGEYQMF